MSQRGRGQRKGPLRQFSGLVTLLYPFFGCVYLLMARQIPALISINMLGENGRNGRIIIGNSDDRDIV